MWLLLDTHIVLALVQGERGRLDPRIVTALESPDNVQIASAVSLWEIAIKTRLGKLDPGLPLERLAGQLDGMGVGLLAIDHRHAVADLSPAPATRDPFDRLLLAQCAVEGLRLVTIDRVLAAHPLAWRPA